MEDDAFNDEKFFARDAAEIAADIVREPELFMKMLNSWRDDILTVRHFVENRPLGTTIPRDIVSRMDLPHQKLTIIKRITYLTTDHCPLVAEFVKLSHESNSHLDYLLGNLHLWRPVCVSDFTMFEKVFEIIDLIQSHIRLKSMMQPTNESVGSDGKPLRDCYERDHTFLRWREEEGMKPAGIRDRWNKENPNDKVNLDTKDNGRSTVKNGLKQARAEQIIERNNQE